MTITPITSDDDLSGSRDLVSTNVRSIAEAFPEAIVDGRIDFDALRNLLGSDVDSSNERYGLSWNGKQQALAMALAPSAATLRPAREGSRDWDSTENVVVEGDNLQVLKLLQKAYAGRVRCIYIDPPYNTGKDFVYPDDFTDAVGSYLAMTGQVDETGSRLTTNPETSGRFHTAWLNMMYPRLKLARELLAPEGVLFISIDDNELRHLLMLCAEVFGDDNLSTTLIRQKKKKPSFLHANIGSLTECVVCVTKDRSMTFPFSIDVTTAGKKYPLNNAGNGLSVLAFPPGSIEFASPSAEFEPQDMSEGKIVTRLLDHVVVRGGVNVESFRLEGEWRYSQGKVDAIVAAGESITIAKAPFRPNHVKAGGEVKKMHNLLTPATYGAGTNEDGSTELEALLGGAYFDNPKPTSLVQLLCRCVTYSNPDALVMDFFAGSGTTGHAVMAQNAADGGNRRYILVQLPEPLDPENKEQKVAADFCQELGVPLNIAELTKERLRRAGEKVKADNPDFEGDTGFRVYRLDSSNIREWDPDATDLEGTIEQYIDRIKPDRSDEDLQTEVLLKLGIELTTPIEAKEIGGKKVSSIGAGALITCFDKAITAADVEALASGIIEWLDELQTAGDTTVVFRDDAFDGDVAKTNLSEMLVQHGVARENVRSL